MNLKNIFKKTGVSTLAGVSALALFSPAVLASHRVRVHYPDHASRIISVHHIKRVHKARKAHKVDRYNARKQAHKLYRQFRNAGYSRNQSLAIIASNYREIGRYAPIKFGHDDMYFGLSTTRPAALVKYAEAHHMSANNPVSQFGYISTNFAGKRSHNFKHAKGSAAHLLKVISRDYLREAYAPSNTEARTLIHHTKTLIK